MHLSAFDYQLPEELIAQQPLERREGARMLVIDRAAKTRQESQFKFLPQYIRPGDVVVVNNTRVFPARLIGRRDPSGGRAEVLLIRELGDSVWEALVRPAQRLMTGARLHFGQGELRAEVIQCGEQGLRKIQFEGDKPVEMLIDQLGQTPLPPYIKRPSGSSPEDRERYQTVFARERGAIAAPTAGLHFTPPITEALIARGAQVVEITLHVGYGTFEPVRVDNIEEHHVAPESFEIGEQAARVISETRAQGGRTIAIGTTTTRALESAVNAGGVIEPGKGETKLTITPGYDFQIVDALLTNFHLPRSSLLLLVCAFAGVELTLEAYRYAVAERFRFYSYGDCMFLF